jgi:putative ABC transport system ATP-binding protein
VPGLKLSGVRHCYGVREVLRVERFDASPGEHWLILGPSGCGKTTLLHLLAGLLRPTSGQVEVAGRNLATLTGHALDRWRGRTLGIVPQKLHLVSSLTVRDNLQLATYLPGLPAEVGRAEELLGSLSLLELANAKPHQLSHGQAQRVALARAVMNRPQLLLADEPTSNLDDAACAAALDLLQSQAQACGATLLVATHDRRTRERFERRLELGA